MPPPGSGRSGPRRRKHAARAAAVAEVNAALPSAALQHEFGSSYHAINSFDQPRSRAYLGVMHGRWVSPMNGVQPLEPEMLTLSALLDGFRKGRARRASLRTLRTLSPAQLRDIGID